MDSPSGLGVKNTPTMQEMQETWVRSLGREDPLEEGMATHSSVLAQKIPQTEELGSTVHKVTKCWTQLKQLNMSSLNYTLRF